MKNQLSSFIQERAQKYQAPVPMTHVIYGYPTIKESLVWMEALLSQGVDILEVQFPFSDPVADGPTIVGACHKALENQPTMSQCLSDIGQLILAYPNSSVLFMSYLNPVYRFGIQDVIAKASSVGIAGIIIPDLPLEQADEYKQSCQTHGINPIWLITPATPKNRIKLIAEQADGMLYCVSRSGVTGQKESKSVAHKTSTPEWSLEDYLTSIRQHTGSEDKYVPLAVGFGIRTPKQIVALHNVADVAIVGSALLEAYERGKVAGGLAFIQSLFPYLTKV